MKDKSVAFIACRVLALYIAIRNAGSVASYIPFLLTSKAELWIQPIAWQHIVSLLLGAVLWFKANTISKYLILGQEEEISENRTVEGLLSVALAVAGVILLVNAIPQIAKIVVDLRMLNGTYSSDPHFKIVVSGRIAEFVLRLVAGTALFIGSKGLVRFYTRLRGLV